MSHIINSSSAGLKQTIDNTKPANHLELAVDGVTKITITPEGILGDFPSSGGGGGSTGPAFSAYYTAASGITATNGTNTKVPVNTVSFTTGPEFSTTTSKFIPGQLGIYQFNFRVRLNGQSNGTFMVPKLYKNGAQISSGLQIYASLSGTSLSSVGSVTAVSTSLTDYFELYVFQNDTIGHPIQVGETETFFSGHFIRGI